MTDMLEMKNSVVEAMTMQAIGDAKMYHFSGQYLNDDEIKFIYKHLQECYEEQQRRLLRRTILRVSLVILVTAVLILLFAPKAAFSADSKVDSLVFFTESGAKTPVGGVGLYEEPFSKRVGTIETLGDGSTVLRGDFGKVLAKVEANPFNDGHTRVTTSGR